MVDFNDIALEYERIKNKPEVIDDIRIKDNKVTEKSADDLQIREKALPSEEQHYKLEQKLSKMFDKSSRAGARSSLNGLVLPNGRKNFADFHNNFTGTGRIQKKEAPKPFDETAPTPKVDTRRDIAMLFERCPDCCERVNRDDCHPNMTMIPPFDRVPPQEAAKWRALDLKPGFWVCWLYCKKCPEKAAAQLKAIRNDRVLNSIMVPSPIANSPPITLAEKRCMEFVRERADRISDTVHAMLKKERENPESQAFYGDAVIQK